MTSKQEKLLQEAKKASLLIALSGLISKILAATYRIPYQNLVGDRGFYAYQQIYPFLALISTLALTGLPNLISGLFQKTSGQSLAGLVRLSFLVSWLGAIGLVLTRRSLAHLMGASQLSPAFLAVAVLLLITPLISLYRGLDQGQGTMRLTAFSQVLEQTVRVLVIVLAAVGYLFYHWDIYQTAVVAAWGSVLASLVALFYLVFFSKVSIKPYLTVTFFSVTALWQSVLPSLVFTLYAVYLLLFQLIDAFLVKNSLVRSGLSDASAEALKGIYDRGQPLIQFGLIVTTALFTSYFPKLMTLYQADKARYQLESRRFFQFITYLSLTLTVGFISLLPAINQVLFMDNQGYLALSIYTGLIFLASLVQFYHQHCFILEKYKPSLACLALGLLVKLMLTTSLTQALGIVGASLATLLSLLVVLLAYNRLSPMSFAFLGNVSYYLALGLMLGIVLVSQSLLPLDNRLFLLVSILLSAGLAGAVFLFLCHKWHVFSKELWSFLPFLGKK